MKMILSFNELWILFDKHQYIDCWMADAAFFHQKPVPWLNGDGRKTVKIVQSSKSAFLRIETERAIVQCVLFSHSVSDTDLA